MGRAGFAADTGLTTGRQLRPLRANVATARTDVVTLINGYGYGLRRHSGLRLSRNACIPSTASGSWLAAAITSTAYA